ncbi:MAG: rod shape-determining protein MreC [Firmicutes bacterium]|nr:rod shape-determining protein MreC [Bacillota bacterium]
MRWIMGRWPTLVTILAAFVLIGLIYLTADGRPQLSPWERKIKDSIAPVYRVFSGLTDFTNHWVGVIRNYSRLQKENEVLLQEIEWMKRRLDRVDQLEQENADLRAALGFHFTRDHQPVAAEIVARSPSNWFDKVVINRGEGDGLKAGDAVVTPAGVVGRIYATSNTTAEVMLINDDRSAFGATVVRTGDPVVIEGSGSLSELRLKPLVKEIDVQTGDQIVTSAMSGIYPQGLPVGVVTAVDKGQYGISISAIVVPHVDLARIGQVFVLK